MNWENRQNRIQMLWANDMMTLLNAAEIRKKNEKNIREINKKPLEMVTEEEFLYEKIVEYAPSLTIEELKRIKEEVLQMA